MTPSQQEHAQASLAQLEARERELQRELAQVRAAMAEWHTSGHAGKAPAAGREVPLAPAWDAPIPISTPPAAEQKAQEATQIYLQALQPFHSLRTKWHLGSGLENALTPAICIPEVRESQSVATELRLYGLLSTGEVWEQIIPFTFIAQETGITLGRSPEDSSYAIDDISISRCHLLLSLNDQGLVVSDLGSTNGTAVNGIPLTAYDNTRSLQDGDTLTIGSVQLQIEFI